jgi:membrane-associated protein
MFNRTAIFDKHGLVRKTTVTTFPPSCLALLAFLAMLARVKEILDYFLHLDVKLAELVALYGGWIYGILFAIIFCETGLVVTPFLPGDSLLFAVGAISHTVNLNLWICGFLMLAAAILGDIVNYWIGRIAGRWMMKTFPRIVKKEYIDKTHHFFQKYGGKTIIIARFLPIVRTFAPFVAGMGHMDVKKFMSFNVTGAVLWVGLLIPAGYFFGRIPVVKENFELVVFGIIGFSLLPMVIEFLKHKLAKRTENS